MNTSNGQQPLQHDLESTIDAMSIEPILFAAQASEDDHDDDVSNLRTDE
jgi:hypothetical protein